jgi:hypothetical protein
VLPSAGGEAWRERYYALKAKLAQPPRCLRDELGPPPPGVDVWERGNLWLLYTGMAYGFERLHGLLLWDGGGGDGPGGTRHMKQALEKRTGRVRWLDTRALLADAGR